LQIERLLASKVFRELFVKVRAGWRDSRDFVEETDWRRQLENIAAGLLTDQPDPQRKN